MQRRCERSNSASSSKLRACWRHVRFRRLADCYRYPNDSRQETAYRFLFAYFFFFFFHPLARSFRGLTAFLRQSSVFIPILSFPLFKRRVCAREDLLNLFHAFCLHMKTTNGGFYFFFLFFIKKKDLITFNNFSRDKMKVVAWYFYIEGSGFH